MHKTLNSCLWGEGGTVSTETPKASWLICGEIAEKNHSPRDLMISNPHPKIAAKWDEPALWHNININYSAWFTWYSARLTPAGNVSSLLIKSSFTFSDQSEEPVQ